jgi:hypothetical protein
MHNLNPVPLCNRRTVSCMLSASGRATAIPTPRPSPRLSPPTKPKGRLGWLAGAPQALAGAAPDWPVRQVAACQPPSNGTGTRAGDASLSACWRLATVHIGTIHDRKPPHTRVEPIIISWDPTHILSFLYLGRIVYDLNIISSLPGPRGSEDLIVVAKT